MEDCFFFFFFFQSSLVGQCKRHTVWHCWCTAACAFFSSCARSEVKVTSTECVCVCLSSVWSRDVSHDGCRCHYCFLSQTRTNKHSSQNSHAFILLHFRWFGKSHLFMNPTVNGFCKLTGCIVLYSVAVAQEAERLSSNRRACGRFSGSVCMSNCPWVRYWNCWRLHQCVSACATGWAQKYHGALWLCVAKGWM